MGLTGARWSGKGSANRVDHDVGNQHFGRVDHVVQHEQYVNEHEEGDAKTEEGGGFVEHGLKHPSGKGTRGRAAGPSCDSKKTTELFFDLISKNIDEALRQDLGTFRGPVYRYHSFQIAKNLIE